jgi:hypothetical protein
MPGHDRIQIDELIALARLEPEMRHIVFEGAFDVRTHKWLLQGCARETEFLSVDQINISADVVAQHGQHLDNHGRVVALAHELDRRATGIERYVRCVADGEFDYVLNKIAASPALDYLDATSPEALVLDDLVLTKFRLFALQHNAPSVQEITRACAPLLRALFAFRATNHDLGWGLVWPGIKPKLENGLAVIEERKFLDQYLNSAQMIVDPIDFQRKLATITQQSAALPLQLAVRGHDIGAVIGVAVKPYLAREHRDCAKHEICERFLLTCLERGALLQRPPLARLAAFVDLP